MSFHNKGLESIGEADLQALVDNKVPESKVLDYKQYLPRDYKDGKKDFLADVSAFANTDGGDLIYGVKDTSGEPSELCGLQISNLEDAIQGLDNMIQNGLEPRIDKIFIQRVPLRESKIAIVIRVPQSPERPHFVQFRGGINLYLRGLKGNFPADQQQRDQLSIDRQRRQQIQEGQRRREIPPDPVPYPRFDDATDVFKNRQDKIAELRNLLDDRTVKFICIVGRAGIGKTALLSRLGAQIERGELRLSEAAAAMGADGILYISYKGIGKPTVGRLFDDVGRVLGSPHADELTECWRDPSRSLADKARFLLSKLRDGCYLLVLDNLEEVLAPDKTIADADLRTFVDVCLSTPHALRLIATSHEEIVAGEGGEHAVRTVVLNTGLPTADAIAFLRDLDPEGRLGLRDAPDELLQTVVTLTFGEPRALRLVARTLSRDRFLTIERLVAEEALRENLEAQGYRLLTGEEYRVMEALAAYNTPVPEAAVRYLLRPFFPELNVGERLRALVLGYFVTYQRGRDIYELHSLDQKHAYAHIPDEGNYRKRALHLGAAEFYRQSRKAPEEWKTIADLQPQLYEFEHLTQAGEYDGACELLNTLDGGEEDADPLSRWGYSSLVVALRKRLAGNLRRTELEEKNWGRLGWAYDELGDATQAIECLQRALDIIATQADNTRDNKIRQGQWLTNMGVAYLTEGKPVRAIGFLERALAIDRELDEKVDEARDLGDLGCAYAELGDVATAIQLQQQALDIDRRENAVHEVAADLGNLGEVCAQVGELDQALAYHNEALEIDKGQEEDENYLAEDLNNLGTVYIALGDWDRAAEYFRQAVDIVRKTAARDLIAEFAPNLGYALWLRSRDPDAVGYIQQGLQAARAIGNRIREATCLRALGRIHHVSDQLDAAQRSYEQAIQCNAFPSNFQCFVGLGILRLQQGDVKMAQECFTRGIAICRTLLEKTPRLYEVLYHLAAAQLGIGLVGDALANYRQALGICSAKGILELGLQDLQMLQRLPQIPDGLPDAIAILEAARQGSRHGKG